MSASAGNAEGRREALAFNLARGLTVKAAAKKARVALRTAHEWRKIPEFADRVRVLRADLFSDAAGRLAGLNKRAAVQLGKLLKSATEKVALQAAVKILELSSRLWDQTELVKRLEALEAAEAQRAKK
jgi:hypothetical protein